MGQTISSCSEGPWPLRGVSYLLCQYSYYSISLSVMLAILATYLVLYFRGKAVWVWLYINCLFMFLGHHINILLNGYRPLDGDPLLARILGPLALICWSISETGDIILFYERYKILKPKRAPASFRIPFFSMLAAAILTRLLDVGMVIWKANLHDGSEIANGLKIQYIEPTYLLFLLGCELLIQYKYFKELFERGGGKREKLGWTLLRSSGARFLLIVIPMFARIVGSFTYQDPNNPNRVLLVQFSTSVNLFTMFDLLMLKYELASTALQNSQSSSVTEFPPPRDGHNSYAMPTANSAYPPTPNYEPNIPLTVNTRTSQKSLSQVSSSQPDYYSSSNYYGSKPMLSPSREKSTKRYPSSPERPQYDQHTSYNSNTYSNSNTGNYASDDAPGYNGYAGPRAMGQDVIDVGGGFERGAERGRSRTGRHEAHEEYEGVRIYNGRGGAGRNTPLFP